MLIALITTGNVQEEGQYSNAIYKGLLELTDGMPNLIHQLNPSMIRTDELDIYDLIVSNGVGRVNVEEARAYWGDKKPWLVYDLGYIKRYSENNKEGYLQLGINKLNWLPELPVNNNRRLIEWKKPAANPKNTVLIAAQMPGDAAHGMSNAQIVKWSDEVIRTIRRKSPTTTIWYRNHPKNEKPYHPEKVGIKDDKTNEYWLDLVGSFITYNSTSGIEALSAGVHVYCDEKAVYSHLAARISDFGTPFQPSAELFNDFFAKIAYSQWTHKELATGQPFKDLISIYNNEVPMHWIETPPEVEYSVSQQEYEVAKQVKYEKKFFTARAIAKQQWPNEVFHNQLELDEFISKKIQDFNNQIMKQV
jgi:hypothetical protein